MNVPDHEFPTEGGSYIRDQSGALIRQSDGADAVNDAAATTPDAAPPAPQPNPQPTRKGGQ